jgi:formiminotetrahydrofolate cyclodeaminase
VSPGEFADQSLHDLLDSVAAQRPAPGGGCSAAWAAAFGAALVEMAASFTLARPKYAGVHHRMADVRRDAKVLRRRLLELGQADAEAYEPVILAMRMPEHHPERAAKLEAAQSAAAEVPLETAEAAARVAELAAETARVGNLHLKGDSVTGAMIAEGASRAAGRLVEINLAGSDDARLARAAEAIRRAAAAREDALAVTEEVTR